MASSIDWGTLTLGTVIGVGCREQLLAAGRVVANTAASLAGAAAQAAQQVAQETKSSDQQIAGQTTQAGTV